MTENDPPARHWLIFSYFSNIDGKASSQHIDDRLPYLQSLGKRPVLLSSVCGERRLDVPHYRVPSAAPSGIRFELRYLKRRNRALKLALLPVLLVVLPFYFLEKIIINLESEWSWFPFAFLRGAYLCGKFRPEIIYSTGGPASAHIAAGLVSHFREIPWIAELQDPLVYKDWSRSRTALKINSALERFILRKASAVIFMCEGAKERSLKRTGTDPAKVHVIYPGASPDVEPRVEYSKGKFCHFAHFGSFGGSRNVQNFLEALHIVFSKNPDLAETVRFDLYGTLDKLSRKLTAEFKYPGVVIDHGKIPRRDALCEMQRSDVLVMIHNLDDLSYEYIPSKFYEYLQMKRPVLGLVYRNAHLKRLLEDRGHFAAEADSATGIAENILDIMEIWGRGDLALPESASSPFTVEAAVKELVDLCEHVTVGSNPNQHDKNY